MTDAQLAATKRNRVSRSYLWIVSFHYISVNSATVCIWIIIFTMITMSSLSPTKFNSAKRPNKTRYHHLFTTFPIPIQDNNHDIQDIIHSLQCVCQCVCDKHCQYTENLQRAQSSCQRCLVLAIKDENEAMMNHWWYWWWGGCWVVDSGDDNMCVWQNIRKKYWHKALCHLSCIGIPEPWPNLLVDLLVGLHLIKILRSWHCLTHHFFNADTRVSGTGLVNR